MQQLGSTVYLAAAILLISIVSSSSFAELHRFQEVIDVIEEKRLELSNHELFKFIADESIPASKRIQFAPYWTYFALAAADVTDNWIHIPNPQSELEYRVNVCIDEDNFHYNLFLHDIESVLGCSPSHFGSYGAILRHLWGDDSKAVRMLIYAWGSGVKHPMVALASFEAAEAGLKVFFQVTYDKIFNGKDGYPDLKYFGQAHNY
jgi:AraC-like DNA-binding protein